MNRKRILLVIGMVIALANYSPTWHLAMQYLGRDELGKNGRDDQMEAGYFQVNTALSLINVGYDLMSLQVLGQPVPDFTLSAGLPTQLLVPASKKIVFDLFDNPNIYSHDTERERAGQHVQGTSPCSPGEVLFPGEWAINVRRRLSQSCINVRQTA
jgi:hypothetical protein